MDSDRHQEWPRRVIEPDANPTDDFSESVQQRRNLITLLVVYAICCVIVTGVWLL